MLQSSSAAQTNSESQEILSSAKFRLLVLITGLTSLSGCDPVRTIKGGVTVEVVDDHGVPVPGVKVSMKESWESWQTWGGGTKESEKSYFRQRWANEIPWLKGVTSTEGKAVIMVKITGLDWTKGNEPPPNRDTLTSREYIIKLDGDDAQEEIRLLMKPGAMGTGKRYSVKIKAIEKPKYLNGTE